MRKDNLYHLWGEDDNQGDEEHPNSEDILLGDDPPFEESEEDEPDLEWPDRTGELIAEIAEELREAAGNREFATFEEFEAFADDHFRKRNEAPVDQFEGLSPVQMASLLQEPFDAPDWVTFPETLDTVPEAPVAFLFEQLATAIGEKGLKTTAKGNLPRNVCRDTALAYWGEVVYREQTRFAGINKEEDFSPLHIVRLLAGLAGLTRKYRGRILLTRRAKSLLSGPGLAGIYPALLRAFATRYNWGYTDGFPDFYIIQESFAFSLFALSRYGDVDRPNQFYEDIFLRAFPMAVEEAAPHIGSQEHDTRLCYTLRTLHRFAVFFGLASMTGTSTGLLDDTYTVRKLPLLDSVVQFHLE